MPKTHISPTDLDLNAESTITFYGKYLGESEHSISLLSEEHVFNNDKQKEWVIHYILKEEIKEIIAYK